MSFINISDTAGMLAPYRAVLGTPGAPAFSGAALVARLPISMFGIAIVLAVSAIRGSYELAGLVSGAALLGTALGAPVHARIADRFGQTRLLTGLLPLHGGLLGAFILVIPGAAPLLLVGAAVLAGASMPQFGALVRARWARLHTGRSTLHTAFSLEAVLDEVVFVLGPPLATLASTAGPSRSGLVLCLVLTVGGGTVYAGRRSTDPGPRVSTGSSGDSPARAPLPVAALAWVVVAFLCLGGIFGSVEVATIGFTDEAGSPGSAGAVLAVFAFGSLLAGLLSGSISWRSGPRRRFVLGAVALSTAMVPLPFIGSIPVLVAFMFLAGFAIAPTLIAGFSMVEAEVPTTRVTEGMAWASTALSGGVALGAALTGPVIDRARASDSFGVPVAFGALAITVCLVGIVVTRRHPSSRSASGRSGSHQSA